MDDILNASILKSVREGLGIQADDNSFDPDIKVHLNGALNTLYQNGAGTPTYVMDEKTKWSDFIGTPETDFEKSVLSAVVLYVTLKVRVLFDPPTAGTMAVLTDIIAEQLFRIQVAYDDKSREEIIRKEDYYGVRDYHEYDSL